MKTLAQHRDLHIVVIHLFVSCFLNLFERHNDRESGRGRDKSSAGSLQMAAVAEAVPG